MYICKQWMGNNAPRALQLRRLWQSAAGWLRALAWAPGPVLALKLRPGRGGWATGPGCGPLGAPCLWHVLVRAPGLPDLPGPCRCCLPCLRHGIHIQNVHPSEVPCGAGWGVEGPWLWGPEASLPLASSCAGAQPARPAWPLPCLPAPACKTALRLLISALTAFTDAQALHANHHLHLLEGPLWNYCDAPDIGQHRDNQR